jgi:hypothetical protein
MRAARPLVVIGAGGFGREALDVVEAVNRASESPVFLVLGVLDDAPNQSNIERLACRGVTYLGAVDAWLADGNEAAIALGVGSPTIRERLHGRLSARGVEFATVVHPSATCGSSVLLGSGSILCAGAQVSTNVDLGRHVHVNPNATVGHDAIIGDFVSINPGAIVSGDCRIERGTLVGAGAVVLQGRTVGQQSVVGAAACVVEDVAGGVTVVGVPAVDLRERPSRRNA